MQSSQVQTYLVSKATQIIHSKANINLTIGGVNFRPFTRLVLEDVYIADLKKDTLLCVDEITTSIFGISLSHGDYRLDGVSLLNPHINFVVDTSGVLNLAQLLDTAFPKDTTNKKEGNFNLNVGQISLTNARFRYGKANAIIDSSKVNFSDLRLSKLSIDGRNLQVKGDTIAMCINSMSFVDQSGLKINDFRSDFSICNKSMDFFKLRINTDNSALSLSEFQMKYDGYNKMGNFTQNVTLNAVFVGTRVNSDLIAYFAPSLSGYGIELGIDGTVRGKINDLRGRNLRIEYGNNTVIATNLNLSGLPNIEQTLFDVDFNELSTQNSDLKKLTKNDGITPLVALPSLVDTVGKITYRGKFVGYLNDFMAYGTVNTDIGNLKIDASISPRKRGGYLYNAMVDVFGVEVGKIAQSNILGKTSLSAKINGNVNKQNDIEAKTDINIHSIEANNYNYSDIKIEGNLTNRTYIGTINLNDPNCRLNFLGKLDFSDTIPVYDFSAFVPRIDLVALNLNKTDSISVASFLLTTKFSGNTLDNSKGEIKLLNTNYSNQRGNIKLSEVAILADNSSDSKVISLKSEFAEGELRGKYNYSSVFNYFTSLISQYIPALSTDKKTSQTPKIVVENPEYNDYLIKLRVKKTKKIAEILTPNLRIAENTSIFGILNPDLQSFTFKMMVPEIKYGSNTIKSLSIDGQTKDSSLITTISTPVIQVGETSIKNFNINLEAMDNLVDFALNWDARNIPANKGSLKSTFDFSHFKTNGHVMDILVDQTNFIVNDSIWQIAPSFISIDTSLITIDRFCLNSNSQNMIIDGLISKNPNDSLSLFLNNINIAALNLYLSSLGYNIDGNISGYAKVNSIYNNPNLFADINIDRLRLNSQQVGNVHFASRWFNDQKRMAIKLNNRQNDTTTFQAQGFIYTENSRLDIDVLINRIKLMHLAPMLKGNVSNLVGNLNGQIKVGGSTSEPMLNGTVNVDNASLMVDFLKTQYSINNPITISNSDVLFRNFKLIDVNKNEAVLNGNITTQFFKKIDMDLNLSTKNFQCMNTTEVDNQSFYASVYGTGMVIVKGSPERLDMNIYMKTENKTNIYLPLSNSSTVEENNFITFISSNPNDIIIDDDFGMELTPQKESMDLNINMEIQVTPEAEAQIIIDKKMGDIIKANGGGNLKIEINPSKNVFKMLGSYEIEKGDYLFTLKSLLNKKLKIENGSSITWNGDPLDANTNITATYRVKTSLKPILGEEYTARIPVDCQILLTQKLMSPNIEFNITLPNGNSDEKVALETALNTQEKINTQFLGLLGINSFISDASVNASSTDNSNLGTMGLYNTVSELLSNQLSNLLSSDKLDFGINYRPGIEEELTSDQVELALSTQIFDDRLMLNGSAFNNNNNDASAPIAGNFNAEFKLNKTGKLRAKAFARYNDDFLNTMTTTENEYTTGVGIMYREEFNNFRDLRFKMRHIFSADSVKPFDFGTEVIEPDSSSIGN